MTSHGLVARVPPRLGDGVVVLRAHVPADAPAITAALAQWQTARWLPAVPYPYDPGQSARWVDTVAPDGWCEGTRLWLAIADPGTDEFLGEIGLHVGEPHPMCAEVGYWLVPAARGRGLMRRALALMVEWAFTELGLERLDWGSLAGNDASRRVAESIGFRMEGTRRQRALRPSDGARLDEWIGGLLRSDWRASRPTGTTAPPGQ